jgi:predicted MFS family arabinose efflux permease
MSHSATNQLDSTNEVLNTRGAVAVFLVFAGAYFLSTLIRAVTATISPVLSGEMGLGAGDLGLLAGGYFLGFALTQLPMGRWLDRFGPRRVELAFLGFAVLGCLAFAMAEGLATLLLARVVTGMGVSACLMAPLTGYRRWLTPATQMRANSWMLMTGSLGMVAATLPVQWLMPMVGWRGLFVGMAGCLLVSMAAIAWLAPVWRTAPTTGAQLPVVSYADVWRHPFFRQMLPLGFVNYGGMVAMQTLWAGPWMVQVGGYTPAEASVGLFGINVAMLVTFTTWGWINPHLSRRGWRPELLMLWGVPLSLLVLAVVVVLGPDARWGWWAVYCISSTVVAQAQPAVALALPAQAAGRALSAFNLAIFSGVFVVQWGLGLAIDALAALGWGVVERHQGAVAIFGLCCCWAYGVFWRRHRLAQALGR